MSDDDRYDELRRRLADEGQAPAPRDIAPAVMRRVRSEPRGDRARILRPLATLMAAAVLAAAALVGIAHLGGSGSSSSGEAAAGAGGGSQAPRSSSAGPGIASDTVKAPKSVIVRHVYDTYLGPIFAPARVPACPVGKSLRADVPAPQLGRVADRLRGAATGAEAGPDTHDVELHRAPKGQTRITITCP
jgi:hypothetical protein